MSTSVDHFSAAEAAAQIRFLEEEVGLLRRKLSESPRHARVLERRLADSVSRLAQLSARNDELAETVNAACNQLAAVRDEVERLAYAPSGYAVFLTPFDDGTVDVFTSGRRVRVTVSPAVDATTLNTGQLVRLDDARTLVERITDPERSALATLPEVLESIVDDGDEPVVGAGVVGYVEKEMMRPAAPPFILTIFEDGQRSPRSRPALGQLTAPNPAKYDLQASGRFSELLDERTRPARARGP